jgi:hypothetical protein
MTAAIAELVGRAFLAQLTPWEATTDDVLAGLRLWGKQVDRARGNP